MTYADLADKISRMTKEQYFSDVTIYLSSKDECYKVDRLEFTDEQEEDRLDNGHPILILDGVE